MTKEENAELLNTGKTLVGLLAFGLSGRAFSLPEGTDPEKLFHFAERHRVTALASYALKKLNSPAEKAAPFQKELLRTAARHTAQQREAEELSAAFSEAKIRHCFLKGMRISALYDIPELRFMLDLDILIEPGRFDDAAEIMRGRGYRMGDGDAKDTMFSKPPFLLVELHRKLKYDYDPAGEYYVNPFEVLYSSEQEPYVLQMADEDFFVYILSHTAHHLTSAGTGLRSVIDDYFLRQKLLPRCDEKLLSEKLRASGLEKLNRQMQKLTDHWFCGGESDELTKRLADYILLSGVYGNTDNAYLIGILRHGSEHASKGGYVWQRLFPDRETMLQNFSVLRKAPVLWPFCFFLRLLKSAFSARRISNEIHRVGTVTETEKEAQAGFFRDLGI